MKRMKKRIVTYLLTLAMMIALVPSYDVAKAEETTVEVHDFSELKDELANGTSDIVKLIDDEDWMTQEYNGTEALVVERDVTIDLNGCNVFIDVDTDYAVVVSNCNLTIVNNSYMGGISGNAVSGLIGVYGEAGDASVTIEKGDYTCNSKTAATIPSTISATASGNYTATVTIENGTFYAGSASSIFQGNGTGASVKILGGTFDLDPTSYINVADNVEVVEQYGSFKVRSTIISDEFAVCLGSDGKIHVPFEKPEGAYDDALMDADMMTCIYLSSFGTDDTEFYPTIAYDPATENLTSCEVVYYVEGSEKESHTVEIVYLDSVDGVAENQISGIADDFSGEVTFLVKDMEVVNFWLNGYDPNNYSVALAEDMVNYSGELREFLGGGNISVVFQAGAGGYDDLSSSIMGYAAFSFEGVYYDYYDRLEASAQNIIYVPDGTATTDAALIAAAQARVDEYLGTSGVVTFSGGDLIVNLDPNDPGWGPYQLDELEDNNPGLDLSGVTRYYTATVNGVQHKVLIVPDSSRMLIPEYETVDIKTDVSISSDASEIPLDTKIEAEKLTSGSEYENVISILGVEENATYDLKLYSNSGDRYISTLSNGNFEVKLPVPATLKGKTLMVYYVDANGEVTPYDALLSPSGDYATFTTNHFSIYTLAEKTTSVCAVNGTAHKLTPVQAKAATTTTEGNKAYWVCDCGKWYADADAKTEITDKKSVVIPKLAADATIDNSAEGEKPEASPATGDDSNILLLMFIMMMAMAAVIKIKANCVRE